MQAILEQNAWAMAEENVTARREKESIVVATFKNGGLVVIRCKDETRHKVVEITAESAVATWDGPLAEFLSDLDSGSKFDWVRTALGEPSSTDW